MKKSIYELKQVSDLRITENIFDQCTYLKINKNNFIILVLYVDDILLAGNNLKISQETKGYFQQNFDMKDMFAASFVT